MRFCLAVARDRTLKRVGGVSACERQISGTSIGCIAAGGVSICSGMWMKLLVRLQVHRCRRCCRRFDAEQTSFEH